MSEKHYKENLSGFVNHELPNDERQMIAEHLLQCADCRREHDEIKLGAALAGQLKQADAPANLWAKIENVLDEKAGKAEVSPPNFAFFGSRGLIASTAVLLTVFGLIAGIYFGIYKNNSLEIVKNEQIVKQSETIEIPQVTATPQENSTNQNTNEQIVSKINSEVENQSANINSNVRNLPEIDRIQPSKKLKEIVASKNDLSSWNIETLAGTPTTGNRQIAKNGRLTVGEFLETDANSKANIQVADIGNVEIAPNSRVKLVKTNSTEHRLSLEKGILKAKILAPPRLFIVDTPSAVAVDLGCEYTLEVDADGSGKLHVTGGFVALEKNGREAIVPAGAMALTKKEKGIGTPFSEDASADLQNALYKFDFENGGDEALQTIIKEAVFYDSLTLWHLLSRTRKAEREKVFEALSIQIKPPANVTREGVLKLDKKMLDAWWKEIENAWFE